MSDWYAGVNSTNSGSFGWLFAAGTSSQTLTPSLFTNAQTFYAPTVTQASSPQTLTPDLYTNGQTFYAATVSTSYALTPALYTNGQTYYAPTVVASNTLLPGRYDNAQAFYAPTVAGGSISPALYVNTSEFYAPTVDNAAVRRFPGFEVDMEPATWWTRKPKAEPIKVARKKLQAVAEIVSEVAQAHVGAQRPRSERKDEVRARLAPLLQEMPGFDWVAMYDRAFNTLIALAVRQEMDAADQARQAIERARARDEDDVVALLLAL